MPFPKKVPKPGSPKGPRKGVKSKTPFFPRWFFGPERLNFPAQSPRGIQIPALSRVLGTQKFPQRFRGVPRPEPGAKKRPNFCGPEFQARPTFGRISGQSSKGPEKQSRPEKRRESRQISLTGYGEYGLIWVILGISSSLIHNFLHFLLAAISTLRHEKTKASVIHPLARG